MKTQSIVLVLAGVLVGCGAGATVAASWAGPTAGAWQCYDITSFDNVAEAATESEAKKFTSAMPQFAPNATTGTVLYLQSRAAWLLCAKN